jgi:hypothetical protein
MLERDRASQSYRARSGAAHVLLSPTDINLPNRAVFLASQTHSLRANRIRLLPSSLKGKSIIMKHPNVTKEGSVQSDNLMIEELEGSGLISYISRRPQSTPPVDIHEAIGTSTAM